MKPLSPCPECGGQRAIFHCDTGSGYALNIPLTGVYLPVGVQLYTCACLDCGHATLHVHPNDLDKLRKEAEKEAGRPSGF